MKDGTFTITIQNGQGPDGTANVNPTLVLKGGYVTSEPAGIACGVGVPSTVTGSCSASFALNTSVVLTAHPDGNDPDYKINDVAQPYQFLGWAGDCMGDTACTLAGNADKYVVAMFAGQRTNHPNFSDPKVHAQAWVAFAYKSAGYLACTDCHGANMQGQGLALSCATCHKWPLAHFDVADSVMANGHGGPWSDYVNKVSYGTYCLRCHTNGGFLDYIGADGSTKNNIAQPYTGATDVSTGFASGILQCTTCHTSTSNWATQPLTQIGFPSGSLVDTDKNTALCGTCHQAYESSVSIRKFGGTAGAEPDVAVLDTVVATGNSFKNPHYLGAAATLFGGAAKGWVQYTGNYYTGANAHGGVASCTSCHDPHTGAVEVSANTCGKCHEDEITKLPVANFVELEESRQFGFEGDIDGDTVIEPLKVEIDGLAAKLYAAIQAYATNVAGASIVYTDAYPYYYDTSVTPNVAYAKFTPRLQRAAVNYKWYKAEPGAWAHNPRYAIEVLYDSIVDLNSALGANAITFNGKRSFNGHFGAADASSPYAAFLDTTDFGKHGGFSDACIQCHGGQNGFATYLANAPAAMPTDVKLNVANQVTGMQCGTCHQLTGTDMKSFVTIANVYFPPQKNGATGETVIAANTLPASFALCGSCHSGRENGATIVLPTTTAVKIPNPHYLGAAAMILGSNAAPMYQYANKEYSGVAPFFNTTPPATGTTADQGPHGSPHGARCVGCHDAKQTNHAFEVKLATTKPVGLYKGLPNTKTCAECHNGGYGLTLPAVKALLDKLGEDLLKAMQSYAATNSLPKPCFNSAGFHGAYFFKEGTGGTCDATDANTFKTTDTKLFVAGFNYTWYAKEPGAYAHNYDYMAEVLYDGIEDLGGTTTVAIDGPGALTLSTATAGSVGITWVAPERAMNVTYKVERAPDNGGRAGTYAVLATGLTDVTYTDSAVTAGTKYWYKVTAVTTANSVATTASVTVPAAP